MSSTLLKRFSCPRQVRLILNLAAIFLLFCQASLAQEISGKVVTENDEPLPGVNVILEGTTIGTTTDAAGEYVLAVSGSNPALVFSFIGYKTERIAVGTQTKIDVKLTPDLKTLNEVVVVGYGVQKKVNMTAAVATISSEDVTSRQSPNTISLLQGRTPGLQIVQNSGQPGAESNDIRIRGQGTFSSAGSNPLILIDGVEGRLDLLNPNMIAEVSVLKDAASAAIYGSRAANGVILVTTKKGKEGRLNIDYSYTYSNQDPSIKIDRVTNAVDYMELMDKAIDHSGRQPTWYYTPDQIEAYRQGAITDPEQYPSYDWTKALIRKAPIHKHFLGLNGGKGGTTFNVGFGVLDETGLLLNTDYKRYDAQINFKSNLGSRVTFGSDISMAKGKRHDTALTTGSTGPDLIDSNSSEDQMLSAYAAPPLTKPVLPDGRFTAYAYPNHGGNKNPIAIATDGGGKNFDNSYLLFSPYMSVNILEGLTADVKGAVKFQEEMAKALVVSSYGYEWFPDANGIHNQVSVWNGGVNSLAQRNTRENQYTLFGTLKYNKTFANNHNLNALLGYQQESYRYDRLDAYRTRLPSKNLWELAAGTAASQTTGSNAYEWAIQSFFGRVSYDFKGKYLFEASFRDDASSRFPKDNRWALFPSLSAGWRIAEESFMSNMKWIDELKLRGSWGQLGNQNIGNYPYQNILQISTGPGDEVLDYNFGGTINQGISRRSLNNANIKWETTTVTDVGLDFSFFNSKLFGSVDWYEKTTKDILRSLQVPDHIGLDAPTINDGIMQNKGWEFIVGHKNHIGAFGYSISANLEAYKNKLVRYGAREISGVNLRQEGLPYNQYYVLLQDGVYQNQAEIDNGPITSYTSIAPKPGDLKYQDISGPDGVPDGKVDLTYDRKPVDGIFPKFNYGMNLSASYKSFDLTIFLQGVYGRKTYVTGWGVSPFNQASAPPSWWMTKAWDGEGTSNTIPAVYVDSGYTPNSQNSTFWLGNSSYLRIKNIQLGYTLPVAWASKVRMQNFRVYASADNLKTFTKFFQGLDPERTATNSARAAIYPQATIYSFGVRATF
jgi:TonB-linked SusC/RagA family outer membrane protein